MRGKIARKLGNPKTKGFAGARGEVLLAQGHEISREDASLEFCSERSSIVLGEETLDFLDVEKTQNGEQLRRAAFMLEHLGSGESDFGTTSRLCRITKARRGRMI